MYLYGEAASDTKHTALISSSYVKTNLKGDWGFFSKPLDGSLYVSIKIYDIISCFHI